MVHKIKEQMAESCLIARILSVLGVLLVLCFAFSMPFTRAFALGDGGVDRAAYLDFDMTYYSTNDASQVGREVYNYPLWNEASSTYNADFYYWGDNATGEHVPLLGFINPVYNDASGVFDYEVSYSGLVDIIYLRYSGLAFWLNANSVSDDYALNDFRLRFDTDVHIVLSVDYQELLRTYDFSPEGAIVGVTQAADSNNVVIERDIPAGQSFIFPAISTDKSIWITGVTIGISSTDGYISTMSVSMPTLSFDALNTRYDNFFNNWFDVRVESNPAVDIDDIEFTDWIVTACSGFWKFEIFPGISIQGIVYGVLGVMFTIMILKYFAGG